MFLFLLSSESTFDKVKVNQLFRNDHQTPMIHFFHTCYLKNKKVPPSFE